MEGYTLTLDFPIRDQGLFPFLDRLDDIVLKHGGRVYLAKDARMRAETFRAMYPRFGEWQRIKSRFDPVPARLQPLVLLHPLLPLFEFRRLLGHPVIPPAFHVPLKLSHHPARFLPRRFLYLFQQPPQILVHRPGLHLL